MELPLNNRKVLELKGSDSRKFLQNFSPLTIAKFHSVNSRYAKSREHEERAPAIFPPAVLIFGLPTQKIC